MSRLRKGWGALAVTAIVAGGVAQGASALPSPQADYQFHNDLSSSIAGAPPMTDLGFGNGFATENVGGCMTRVLSFPEHNGLTLDTSGLRSGPPFDVRVVLDFRLADVSGFRRLIQTTDHTSDSGLYVHDGKLDWYQGGSHEGGPVIVSNQFVEVTLLQSSILSQFTMIGFVNGVQQFSFTTPDSTEVGPQLRLFKDNDPPGASDEDSAGEVFRVRFYGSAGLFPQDIPTVYAQSLLGNPSSCPAAGASRTGKPRATKNTYGVYVDTGVVASCPDTGIDCSGTASVQGPGAKKSKKGRSLGSTAITVPSGKSQAVAVKLGKRGRKRLALKGKLKVTASVALTGPNGKPVTAQSAGKIKAPRG